MAMHELRVLIAEKATMNIYIKGEYIELDHNYIGILLEGFLKTKNQYLITPPGVLLPSNSDLNLYGLQSSAMNHIDYCYTAPSYQVEARARIIFVEMGRLETETDLPRSASLLPQTLEPPRTMSKEHSGLLSWPESFRRSRGPQNASLTKIRNQPGSFSARALQLSMYGSMMNDMHSGQRRRRLHRGVQADQKQSSSYPRVPSRTSNTRPLLSVQSEGSNLMNRKAAPSPAPAPRRRRRAIEDDKLSDDSAGEEGIIVRVCLSVRRPAHRKAPDHG